jgi:hypothetical protein
MAIADEYELSGLAANRPAAGHKGLTYYATDTYIGYIDTGTSWKRSGPRPKHYHGAGNAVEQAHIADISGANLTTPVAHTETEAIDAEFADLPAARTSVNALRTNVEIALSQLDSRVGTAVSQTETRLDAIETKINALLAALEAAGILADA